MTSTYPHPVRTEWKILAILRRDNPGITQTECSKQLGVNINTIRHWLVKPLYQSYENWLLTQTYEAQPLTVKRARAAVKEELDEFAEEMLGRLKEIVETTNDDKLIAQIGFDMLDRAGYDAPKQNSNRGIQFVLTPEAIAMLQRRHAEILDTTTALLGEVVEATA